MKRIRSTKSACQYILEGLIPYTDANLKLTFKPGVFFNELEKLSGRSQRTLRNEFYKLQCEEYIFRAKDMVGFTEAGLAQLELYVPRHIPGDTQLMVIFDIPEQLRSKRSSLRATLRQFHFKQIQKSVWVTKYECRKYLALEIHENRLEPYVQMHETKQLSL